MSTDWRLAGSAVALSFTCSGCHATQNVNHTIVMLASYWCSQVTIPALAWLCMAVDSTGSSQSLDHLHGTSRQESTAADQATPSRKEPGIELLATGKSFTPKLSALALFPSSVAARSASTSTKAITVEGTEIEASRPGRALARARKPRLVSRRPQAT